VERTLEREAEAGSGRMRFAAADGFGVEAGIVSEPPHVRGVVQRFVGKGNQGRR
jgi:hypothetical protein